MELRARRGGEHWRLQPDEKRMLADALDPPLARVPLPEKELGVIGELGALGFVCFGIFGPRVEMDKAIAAARKPAVSPTPAERAAVVSEAERIAAAHAAAPYGNVTELDGFRTGMDESAGDLGGVTVGETHPTFITDVDAIAREHGITPSAIVELRQGVGAEGDLLDAYGTITDGDGKPLERGV